MAFARAHRFPFRFSRMAAMTIMSAGAIACTLVGGLSQEAGSTSYEVEGRRSGYLFLGEGTRDLQDDDFQNPGMFAVQAGRRLWNLTDGDSGLSCASCHGDAADSMRGVAARYPQYDSSEGRLLNLELRIASERSERMQATPYAYESDEMLALSAYVSFQSRGMPMDVDIDGPARPYFEEGREFYHERRGQLDLACSQCHDKLVGANLRGDVISQGQVNGFPLYRLLWSSMGSRHRMFEWCNTSMRAEPFEYGSTEYLSLELYVAWRGRGLPIEAPAVRR